MLGGHVKPVKAVSPSLVPLHRNSTSASGFRPPPHPVGDRASLVKKRPSSRGRLPRQSQISWRKVVDNQALTAARVQFVITYCRMPLRQEKDETSIREGRDMDRVWRSEEQAAGARLGGEICCRCRCRGEVVCVLSYERAMFSPRCRRGFLLHSSPQALRLNLPCFLGSQGKPSSQPSFEH